MFSTGLMLVFCLAAFSSFQLTDSAEVRRPRGVSLARASLYNPDVDFTCFDGSAAIPFKYVNDDYCDCQDGSDEPGTAACPNGSFYCKNSGHVATVITSSMVNDGICDCCDASDEYASGAGCSNTCREMGAAALEEAQRRFELENRGYAVKLDYMNQGKSAKQSHQERLVTLKAEQVEAEALQSEREEEKKAAEEPERQALDQYRQAEQEIARQKEESEKSKRHNEAEAAFDYLDTNKDGKLGFEEVQERVMFDQNGDGVVSEEEAKFFLHMDDAMEKSEFLNTGWILMRPYFNKAGLLNVATEIKASHVEEELEGADDDDEREEVEEVEEAEEAEVKPPTPPALQYDPETQALVDAANSARNLFDEAERRLREIEREVRKLEESDSKDYGLDEEFQPLEGHCFDYTDREYTYRLCPFDNASQRPKQGGSETRLGSWDSWDGPADDKYSRMKYDRGVQCWNGPQRSAKVYLYCGVENELISVSEPNRCEYELKFTTPAVCKEPKKPGDVDEHDEHDEL